MGRYWYKSEIGKYLLEKEMNLKSMLKTCKHILKSDDTEETGYGLEPVAKILIRELRKVRREIRNLEDNY